MRDDARPTMTTAQRRIYEKTGNPPQTSALDDIDDPFEIKRPSLEDQMTARKKPSKYGNRKVVVDGITFDSVRESARYTKLAAMRSAGEISDLRIQVPFEIVPAAVVGGRKRPARKYIADFVYADAAGNLVVEDVKGMRTAMYSIKRQLVKVLYGIDIVEVK
ncbi:DUF1064 domain-containing protein [Paraburkholderia phenoliruptrix]|uniref:DUF1064 domain-containing protein n=1 Tax=Paraburkholderia phenoliruptrix TaxID=252970 RepID=UPI003209CDA7